MRFTIRSRIVHCEPISIRTSDRFISSCKGIKVDKPGMTVTPRPCCETVTANLSRNGEEGGNALRAMREGMRLMVLGRSSVASALRLGMLGAWAALTLAFSPGPARGAGDSG